MTREEKIMARVREHYAEALTLFSEDRVVGIFLQGSQNYGLDYEDSDVDTKLIVVPTLDDLIFNRPPVSTTHVRENNEHIDLKDVRLMFQTFRKQNLNFIEILFTEFKIVNPMYEDLWNEIVENNEAIARYNPHKAVTTMKGIASEKHHALCRRYPAKADIIDKYGYDGKQLSHLYRVLYFMRQYIDGESYKKCLKAPQRDFLIKLKKQGFLTLEDAKDASDLVYETVNHIADEYRAEVLDVGAPEIEKLLDRVQSDIMRRSLIYSLKEE